MSAPGRASSTSRSSWTASPAAIVAWNASTSKTTPLVLTPLRMALWERDRSGTPVPPGQLICHADAGSQYTSVRFTEHLALEGIRPSIGTVADAYDNSLMESTIGLYKTECIATNGLFTVEGVVRAGASVRGWASRSSEDGGSYTQPSERPRRCLTLPSRALT